MQQQTQFAAPDEWDTAQSAAASQDGGAVASKPVPQYTGRRNSALALARRASMADVLAKNTRRTGSLGDVLLDGHNPSSTTLQVYLQSLIQRSAALSGEEFSDAEDQESSSSSSKKKGKRKRKESKKSSRRASLASSLPAASTRSASADGDALGNPAAAAASGGKRRKSSHSLSSAPSSASSSFSGDVGSESLVEGLMPQHQPQPNSQTAALQHQQIMSTMVHHHHHNPFPGQPHQPSSMMTNRAEAFSSFDECFDADLNAVMSSLSADEVELSSPSLPSTVPLRPLHHSQPHLPTHRQPSSSLHPYPLPNSPQLSMGTSPMLTSLQSMPVSPSPAYPYPQPPVRLGSAPQPSQPARAPSPPSMMAVPVMSPQQQSPYLVPISPSLATQHQGLPTQHSAVVHHHHQQQQHYHQMHQQQQQQQVHSVQQYQPSPSTMPSSGPVYMPSPQPSPLLSDDNWNHLTSLMPNDASWHARSPSLSMPMHEQVERLLAVSHPSSPFVVPPPASPSASATGPASQSIFLRPFDVYRTQPQPSPSVMMPPPSPSPSAALATSNALGSSESSSQTSSAMVPASPVSSFLNDWPDDLWLGFDLDSGSVKYAVPCSPA